MFGCSWSSPCWICLPWVGTVVAATMVKSAVVGTAVGVAVISIVTVTAMGASSFMGDPEGVSCSEGERVDDGSSAEVLSPLGCSWMVVVVGVVEDGATVAVGRFVVLGLVLGVCVAGAFAVGLFVVEASRRLLAVVPFEEGLLLEGGFEGIGKGT